MRFVKSFVITLFSQGVIIVTGFLNGVIITRNLGPGGRGEYAMVSFMVTIILVLMGEGLYRSNIYLASRDKSEQNLAQLGSNILVYGVLVALIMLLLGLLPDRVYAVLMPGIKPVYIYLGLGTTLAFIMNRQFQGLFLGLQKFWHYNLLNSLPIVLFLVLDFSVLIITRNLTTFKVLTNFFLSMLAVAVLGFYLYYRPRGLRILPDAAAIRQSLFYGWRATLAYLLIFLLIRLNLYIVNYAFGVAQAGLFAVAVNIATLIQRVPNVASVVLLPRVSERETTRKLALTTKVAAVSLLFCVASAAFFYFAGEQLLIWLYKEAFAKSYQPLVWLLPGIIVFSIAGIYNTALWGQGFPPITIWAPLAALLADLIACALLIPSGGIVGAAQAATVSYVVFGAVVFGYVYWNRKSLNR